MNVHTSKALQAWAKALGGAVFVIVMAQACTGALW